MKRVKNKIHSFLLTFLISNVIIILDNSLGGENYDNRRKTKKTRLFIS